MRGRGRASSIVFVSLLAAAAMGTAAPASAQSAPSFTLSPSSGPVGTTVQFTGQVDPSQIEAFRSPAYFTLLADVPGCELLVDLHNTHIGVDDAGAVSGSFTVGGTGQCF